VSFLHNSDLYADPTLAEGRDYARRYRRHERFDDTVARTDDVPKTTILAPHGGGIEPGTSELCLAVAGYHPANLAPAEVTYDYVRSEGAWVKVGGTVEVRLMSKV
jgi:Poly-gamma-glutamate hydrolase